MSVFLGIRRDGIHLSCVSINERRFEVLDVAFDVTDGTRYVWHSL